MAQGFSQTAGIDYGETYAPVSRYATFRALMAHVVGKGLCMAQLDIKTAFLNGDIEEEIYMKLPPGFETLAPPGSVCRLLKAIYGLKQAQRAWNKMFVEFLTGEGVQASCWGRVTLLQGHRTWAHIRSSVCRRLPHRSAKAGGRGCSGNPDQHTLRCSQPWSPS